jgi:hypothetical protein
MAVLNFLLRRTTAIGTGLGAMALALAWACG